MLMYVLQEIQQIIPEKIELPNQNATIITQQYIDVVTSSIVHANSNADNATRDLGIRQNVLQKSAYKRGPSFEANCDSVGTELDISAAILQFTFHKIVHVDNNFEVHVDNTCQDQMSFDPNYDLVIKEYINSRYRKCTNKSL
ncbi:Hypothetical_protein [Hexamita inflata]|uniref:Hypothetical_protein n=1 Tax=Hexamita inflata TaxID=28002 RepID=A0AA86P2X3_9EUKA|nr:Hypothetical protein HINF_LOCUS16882 [Hexamita inflata]